MTSWRDTTSQTAQDDLDGLLAAVLPLAENLLGKRGEFYPFGGAVSDEGETSLTAADPAIGEYPGSEDVLQSLYDGARAGATSTRAAAFVSDVRVEGSDAIRVELEHREGATLAVLLPYRRGRVTKQLTFGQMSVSEGEPRVWAD